MKRVLMLSALLALCLPMVGEGQSIQHQGAGGGAVSVLYKSTAAVATSGTSEEVLQTYTLPANTLSEIGTRVDLLGTCSHAATANSRAWRLEWGGISGTVLTTVSSASSGIKTVASASCIRTGASTASCLPTTWTNAGGGSLAAMVVLTGVDFTAPVSLVLTATTPVAAGDLECEAFVVSSF